MNSSGGSGSGGSSDTALCYYNTSECLWRREAGRVEIKLISVAILTSLGSDGLLQKSGFEAMDTSDMSQSGEKVRLWQYCYEAMGC